MRCLIVLILLAGCAGSPMPERTLVYQCGGSVMTVRELKREAQVYLASSLYQLKIEAAKGGRSYSTSGVELQLMENTAILKIDGRVTTTCKRTREAEVWEDARLRGVNFRAFGSKPGWSVELKEQQLLYAGNYGATLIQFPDIQQTFDDQQARTTVKGRWAGHEIELGMQAGVCRDATTGEVYSVRVFLELDGQITSGCGRNLP